MRKLLYILPLLVGLAACNLEQEIELELPVVENKLVVEGYLEPGQPFNLLLTRTAGYFEPFPTDEAEFVQGLLVDDATVVIRHQGNTYELESGFFFNPVSQKFFNYGTNELVPEDYENDFELEITTAAGAVITATTRLIEPVPIDSVVVQFNNTDTMARALMYFSDDPEQPNFYRHQLHEASLDSMPIFDFPLNDGIVENGIVVLGTGDFFTTGDTLIHTLLHIDRPYYDFLVSYQNAVASNGNPFAQPGGIISNVAGEDVIGIFTGISLVREQTIID